MFETETPELARKAHDYLIASFASNESGQTIYPEYYGGSYIDRTGKLNIYVKKGFPKPLFQFPEIPHDIIVYRDADYSYNELNATMDSINAFKIQEPNNIIAHQFSAWGVYDERNRIVVHFDNLALVGEFQKHVSNSSAIVFEQGSGNLIDEISVDPGSAISTSAGTGSVGYRVKKNDVAGIVTAAHLVTSIGQTVYYGGVAFASCTARQQSGSVDAAFCAITNSSYTPTNNLYGTSYTLSTELYNPKVGDIVNKIGATTGLTSGIVTSINASGTFSGITFTNLTQADYSSAPGDSGCIVYALIGTTRYTCGIHKGAGNGYAYFVKASEIRDKLNVIRY